MPSRNLSSNDKADIRRLIDGWTRAVRAKDVTAAMAGYAPEIVSFDLAPPLEYRGAAAIARSLEGWFSTFRGPVGYEMRDLTIAAGDSVAFSRSLNRITGSRTDGTETDVWVRATVCFQKVGGRWAITHEHVSVPFEMTPPFKAALGLQP